MKRLPLWDFDVPSQPSKIADVSEQSDVLPLNAVVLHWPEYIVVAMFSGPVKVSEVFEIGFVPSESSPTEDQHARPRLNGLRGLEACFEVLCVV
jgi:hypothetical protein